MPLITKATRITHHTQTLIEHIYTNTMEKVVISGICLADITDHLSIFCTLSSKPQTQSEHKMYRDFSKFNNAAFIEDLNQINFVNLVSSDVNESILNVINILQKITDKHAPIKKTPQSKRHINKLAYTKCRFPLSPIIPYMEYTRFHICRSTIPVSS